MTMVRFRLLVALGVGVLLGASAAQADAYTYDLVDYPNDQSGWSLSGSITVDQLGPISAADITDFTWTVTQAGQPSYTLTLGTSEIYVGGSALNATATELTFDASLLDCVLRLGDTNNYLRYATGINDYGTITSPVYQASGEAWYWFVEGPAMSGSDLWVIARNAAVPTPTSAGLFVTTVALVLGQRRRRPDMF
jgi:hypothetical protein